MRLASKILFFLTAIVMACPSVAQNWYMINTHSDSKYNYNWSFPYEISQFPYSDFSSDGRSFRMFAGESDEDAANYVPYAISMIDSVTFVD